MSDEVCKAQANESMMLNNNHNAGTKTELTYIQDELGETTPLHTTAYGPMSNSQRDTLCQRPFDFMAATCRAFIQTDEL